MGESRKKKIFIYIGSDHAGFYLKEKLKKYLKRDFELIDMGAYSYDKDDDYVDFIIPVARKVSRVKNRLGIVFGGSGQGEAIAANKIRGVRCTVYYGGPDKIINLSKEHNNANMLSIGARFLNFEKTKKAVDLWINANFSNHSRHKRRIKKIEKLGSA